MNLWEKQGHKIYHGDAIEVLQNFEDSSIDLIFADPPYNIGKKFADFHDKWESDEAYAKWCYQWIDQCIRVLKRSGSLYVMTSTQAMPLLDLYIRERLSIMSRIIWHYDSSGMQAKRYYGSTYEPILFCVKDPKSYIFNADDVAVEAKTGAKRRLIDYRKPTPTPYNTTKVPGNVWEFPRVRYRMDEYEDHPSQKPEALLDRIIRASSMPGDLVLDPFCGAFTTCAVAKRLDRRTVGIESQEDYVKVGLRRVLGLMEFNGQPLKALEKTYERRNSNGKHGVADVGGLFDVVSEA